MNRAPLSTIIHKKHIFLTSVLGFFLATGLVSYFEFASTWILVLMILLGIQMFLLFWKTKWFIFFFLLGFTFGYIKTMVVVDSIHSQTKALIEITHNYSWKNTIRGSVRSLISADDTSRTYLLDNLVIENKPLPDIKLKLSVPLNSFIKEWDAIAFSGNIRSILPSDSFAFDKYFLSKDIYGSVSGQNITISWNSLSIYDAWIISLREGFSKHIQAVYPPQTAAFLGGLLFGEKQNLEAGIIDDFKLSWLSHIIAVSGFNITILIVFCTSLLRFLPTWLRVSIITLVVCVFISLVWEQVSALRAAIMWLAGYYAISFDRRADIFYILLGTAFYFVLLHPYTLNYDVSFHLSFLAVAGMIFVTPFLKKLFSRVPEFLGMKEALIATLGALAFTFPISLVNFWQLPLLSPISNILTTPLIPLTMLVGFLSILFDIFSHTFAVWFGFIGWGLLEYILQVAHFFASLKNTILQADIAEYSIFILSGYYLFLIYLILFWKLKNYTSSSMTPSSFNLSWESIKEA